MASAGECGTCRKVSPDDYMNAMWDAERRMAAGQEQRPCPECGLWRWPEELPPFKGVSDAQRAEPKSGALPGGGAAEHEQR